MKDPLVHVEKTLLGMGHIEMSDLIARATRLAPDLPKTCGTGCGRRRQLADTSKVPERVTCLACREWAAEQEIQQAGSAEALASLGDAELARLAEPGKPALTAARLLAMAYRHRAMAARYGWRNPDQATDRDAQHTAASPSERMCERCGIRVAAAGPMCQTCDDRCTRENVMDAARLMAAGIDRQAGDAGHTARWFARRLLRLMWTATRNDLAPPHGLPDVAAYLALAGYPYQPGADEPYDGEGCELGEQILDAAAAYLRDRFDPAVPDSPGELTLYADAATPVPVPVHWPEPYITGCIAEALYRARGGMAGDPDGG